MNIYDADKTGKRYKRRSWYDFGRMEIPPKNKMDYGPDCLYFGYVYEDIKNENSEMKGIKFYIPLSIEDIKADDWEVEAEIIDLGEVVWLYDTIKMSFYPVSKETELGLREPILGGTKGRLVFYKTS